MYLSRFLTPIPVPYSILGSASILMDLKISFPFRVFQFDKDIHYLVGSIKKTHLMQD